jgi:ABC-type uncharacterized transport system substrate-binding protein
MLSTGARIFSIVSNTWQAVQGRFDREWPHRKSNITIDNRFAEGNFERMQEIAANFARRNLDLIVVALKRGAQSTKA